MKRTPLLAALPLFLASVLAALAQTETVTLPQASPKATVSQTIGITDVTVVYHRPSVAKREIWGKLEPYGYVYRNFGTSRKAPWRAGANENTTIAFAHDVTVAGKPLPADIYGLFMGLTPEGAVTVIFSKNYKHWGSFFYDESRDALRVDVKWEDAPFHELLTYEFTDVTEDSAVLALLWEKKRIPIPLKVATVANTVASLKDEMANSNGFKYQGWFEASRYLFDNNVELPLALQWAEASISGFFGVRNFNTLSNKAQILEKMNRAADAQGAMDDALKVATVFQIHQFGRTLLARGEKDRALAVFKLNAEKFPHVWPVNYGLARGYSAVGDYKSALEVLLLAQKEVPEGDTQNAEAIKANIEKLKRGENIN